MVQKEKFGKFVLLEQVDSSPLGTEYRAAKLGPGGLDKIVSLIRLAPAFSTNAEVAKSLMEQAKTAAQLQSPNIQKILGIGKVEGSYYISYEFLEGKSLRSIYERCRQEGFPMSVDHALLIASKICSALEHAHSRKVEGIGRFTHGYLTPSNVLVSYEGELKVRGFGYWPAGIWSAGFVVEDEAVYLAPEQLSGQSAETRSDIYAVGTILFEALVGRPLFEPHARARDASAQIAAARLHCAPGEDEPLPKPIAEILSRALAADPNGRQLEVQELRKAIDTLLFSGDFTPTTFNLAFFMHSLFRDDIERESKALKQEREASYFEHLAEAPPAAAAPLGPSPVPIARPIMPPPIAATPLPASSVPIAPARMTPTPPAPSFAAPASPPPLQIVPPPIAAHLHTPTPMPPPLVSTTPIPREPTPAPIVLPPHRPPTAETAAPIFAHAERAEKSRMGLIAIIAVILVAVGAGGFFGYRQLMTPRTTTTTLSPQMIAALDRERQLKEQLGKLQDEAEQRRKEAEIKAEEEARKHAADEKRIATEREIEASKKKAREEEARRQEEERQRLEQQRQQELERIKQQQEEDERRRKEEEARRAAAPTPPPATPTPNVPATPSIYGSESPGITAPVRKCGDPIYPAVARIMGASGTVRIMFLVDESGRTSDIRIMSGPEVFRQPAIDFITKCTFIPAIKDKAKVKFRMIQQLQYAKPR